MTAKSILDIEVNDAAFKKFAEQFGEYQKLLEGMPQQWSEVNEALKIASESFAAGAASVAVMAEEMRSVAANQERFEHATEKSSRAMSGLARHAAGLARTVGELAKWTGLGGLLIGGAGLFGIDRLAHSVFGARRAALGLGVTMGEQSAFRVNYGQFVDPDSTLSNVANARNDLSQRWAFSALGIGQNQLASLDNADLARAVTEHARDIWLRGPQTQQYAEARGLTQFFSMEELRRLGAASGGDMASAGAHYREDRGAFSVEDDLQRQWQAFSLQLRRAGLGIERTFVRGLAPLTPGLTHLSEGVSRLIEAFLGSDGIRKAIKNLGNWLDDPRIAKAMREAADYLGSPKFSDDIHQFVDGISYAAHRLADAMRWLGILPGGGSSAMPSEAPQNGTPSTAMSDYSSFKDWKAHNIGFQASVDAVRDTIDNKADAYGVPKDLTWNLFGAETSFGKGHMVSPTGAQGWFQFMPETAKQYGVDPWDAKQSTEGAMSYLRDLNSHFHDWRKSVAAYNWGPKNVDEDVRQHGSEWEKFLPEETKKELARAFPAGDFDWSQPDAANKWNGRADGDDLARTMERLRRTLNKPAAVPLQVTVSNDTASRVAVSANMVAQ